METERNKYQVRIKTGLRAKRHKFLPKIFPESSHRLDGDRFMLGLRLLLEPRDLGAHLPFQLVHQVFFLYFVAGLTVDVEQVG
jgi:hypothetical protein